MPDALIYPGKPGRQMMRVLSIRKLTPEEMRAKRGDAEPDGEAGNPGEETAEGELPPIVEFEVACSSEEPVERLDFWTGKRYREVLGHKPGECDLGRFESGRAPVLIDHRGDLVGVIRSARIDKDRVLRAIVRLSRSERGREIAQDILDEIRQSTSIGYDPREALLVEQNDELGDLWRVTNWEALELSLVSVPADATVGVGRSAEDGTHPVRARAAPRPHRRTRCLPPPRRRR